MLAKLLRGTTKTTVKQELGGKGKILGFSTRRNPRNHLVQFLRPSGKAAIISDLRMAQPFHTSDLFLNATSSEKTPLIISPIIAYLQPRMLNPFFCVFYS